MLKIKQVGNYKIAKYPKGIYRRRPKPEAVHLLRTGALSASVILTIEACFGGGTATGGLPTIEPMTEMAARNAIVPIFASNGIVLTEDVTLPVEIAAGDTVALELDGYNDSLQIGYEYVTSGDRASFTHEARAALDSLVGEGDPTSKCSSSLDREMKSMPSL